MRSRVESKYADHPLGGMVRVVIFAAAVFCAAPTHAGTNDVEMSLREIPSGAYALRGHFSVDAPRSVVWAVLTDYDGIGRFVSSIQTSVVRERHEDRLLLEQVAVGRVLIFSQRVHVMLVVREDDQSAIRFVDVHGGSFETYSGQWLIREEDGRIQVSYELDARPTFKRPGFIMKRSMGENARRLLEEVRLEIVARTRALAVSRTGSSGERRADRSEP